MVGGDLTGAGVSHAFEMRIALDGLGQGIVEYPQW